MPKEVPKVLTHSHRTIKALEHFKVDLLKEIFLEMTHDDKYAVPRSAVSVDIA